MRFPLPRATKRAPQLNFTWFPHGAYGLQFALLGRPQQRSLDLSFTCLSLAGEPTSGHRRSDNEPIEKCFRVKYSSSEEDEVLDATILDSRVDFLQCLLYIACPTQANATASRFFYNVLETGVFVPSLIPLTLRNVRAAMFPSNKMGPPAPPPPGEEEQLQIRRKAAEDLLSLVPMPVLRIFLSTDNREQMLDEVEEDILDPFGDESMNKHLIYSILELVVLRLVPEMADKTPSELLAERGVVAGTDEKDTIND